MPMHPRPMAETVRPLRPSLRVFMMATPEGKLRKLHPHRCHPTAEDSRTRVGRTLLSVACDLDFDLRPELPKIKKGGGRSVCPTQPYLLASCGVWPNRWVA